jgi:hypothetical protein
MIKKKKNYIVVVECGDDTLNINLNGKMYVVDKTNTNYKNLLVELKKRHKNFKKIETLLDIPKCVSKYTSGKVVVKNNKVFYNKEEVHSTLADLILRFISEGLNPRPWMKFMNNLMDNPSKWAVDSVVEFLTRKSLPITKDGCFIAYKTVRPDYYDWYSGTFLNKVGAEFDMPRNKVDDDKLKDCSTGWHVGNLDYIRCFHSDGKILTVKVNPRDVISVPQDSTCDKIRVCHYKVIGEHNSLTPLSEVLYINEQLNKC